MTTTQGELAERLRIGGNSLETYSVMPERIRKNYQPLPSSIVSSLPAASPRSVAGGGDQSPFWMKLGSSASSLIDSLTLALSEISYCSYSSKASASGP